MNMRKKGRCIIITSFLQGSIRDCLQILEDDYILCADGGLDLAIAEKIRPHMVLGDFDSAKGNIPKDYPVIQVSSDKDETDTLLCLQHGLGLGYENFIILGGMGGRFDHTLANLQMLSYLIDSAPKDKDTFHICLLDELTYVTLIENSSVVLLKEQFSNSYSNDEYNLYLSVFSYSDKCTGVTITGAKYPLQNAILTSSFPLGVSNSFLEDSLEISCASGKLIIMVVKEKK